MDAGTQQLHSASLCIPSLRAHRSLVVRCQCLRCLNICCAGGPPVRCLGVHHAPRNALLRRQVQPRAQHGGNACGSGRRLRLCQHSGAAAGCSTRGVSRPCYLCQPLQAPSRFQVRRCLQVCRACCKLSSSVKQLHAQLSCCCRQLCALSSLRYHRSRQGSTASPLVVVHVSVGAGTLLSMVWR
jgi:hypothetical protein